MHLLLLFVALFMIHIWILSSLEDFNDIIIYLVESLGIFGGYAFGRAYVKDTRKRIVGNIYYLDPLPPKLRIVMMSCLVGVVGLMLSMVGIPKNIFVYIALPGTLVFPAGVLMAVVWLVQHERVHGPVYIKRRTK